MVQVIYKQTDKIKKYKFNLCVSKVTKNETKHLWNLVTKNDVSDNLLSTNLRLKSQMLNDGMETITLGQTCRK